MDMLLEGFRQALGWSNLGYALAGCFIGTLIGVLPGLGPASAMAILLPATAYLSPEGAIIALAGIYYGAMYGGSTTAILLNIPGEAASTVTCADGFPMTQQGRAGEALAIAALGSFMAGMVGTVVLAVSAPAVAGVAYYFGPPEYFGLILFALISLISLSSDSLLRSATAGAFGLWLASFGADPLAGAPRLHLGTLELTKGFDLIAVMVGLFGIAEVLSTYEQNRGAIYSGRLATTGFSLPRGRELRRGLAASARGTGIGFVLGLLPGMLTALTAWIAYDAEKRISRTPERFGKGAIEGVAAPEAANNATAMAGFVPLFALGLPTSPVLAIMLGAFMLNGLQPGPQLFTQHGSLIWTIIASMFIGNVVLLVLNLPLVRYWAMLSMVPYRIMGPVIVAVCLISAYSSRNAMLDVWVAVGFGLLGYLLRRLGWSVVPLVLGFLLGPLLEAALRQSLAISGGSVSIFWQQPICLGFLIATVVLLVVTLRLRRRSATAAALMREGGLEA